MNRKAPAMAELFARQRQERVEFVESRLNDQASPEQIADELGVSAQAVAQSMRRAGRADLARPFWNADRRHRMSA